MAYHLPAKMARQYHYGLFKRTRQFCKLSLPAHSHIRNDYEIKEIKVKERFKKRKKKKRKKKHAGAKHMQEKKWGTRNCANQMPKPRFELAICYYTGRVFYRYATE